MCILVCPNLIEQHYYFAKELLAYFVKKASELNGPEFVVYNVHSMLHIADDAKQFCGLDKCSGFQFENYNQK